MADCSNVLANAMRDVTGRISLNPERINSLFCCMCVPHSVTMPIQMKSSTIFKQSYMCIKVDMTNTCMSEVFMTVYKF